MEKTRTIAKNKLVVIAVMAIFFVACAPTQGLKKSQAYESLYQESPQTFLIMMPINMTNNVEIKEVFYTTLTTIIAERGYYVMPPFLCQEILRSESANDSEWFENAPLQKFGEVFGADAVLFTTIYEWRKQYLLETVTITVAYVLKSTKTNNVLFARKGTLIYDIDEDDEDDGGFFERIIDSIVNTALVGKNQMIHLSRNCNEETFEDLPAGKYHPKHLKDSVETAGLSVFTINQ